MKKRWVRLAGNEDTASMIRAGKGKAEAFTVDVTDREAVYRGARQAKEVTEGSLFFLHR